ncbi:unnamed protein product [Camellia sinensis]
MSKAAVDVPLKGGFSFDLCKRNEMLSKKGVQASKFLKTGTTIVGLIFQDGVILGASQEPLKGPLLLIRIVRKSILCRPTFITVEQALLLIQRQ